MTIRNRTPRPVRKLPFVVMTLLLLSVPAAPQTVERAPRITDREIIEGLIRLEEGQKALRQLLNGHEQRFTAIDQRFTLIERRLANAEQRLTNVEQRLTSVEERLTNVEQRLTSVEERLTNVEQRLTSVEERLTSLEQRLTGVEERLTSLEQRLTGVEQRLTSVEQGFGRLEQRVIGLEVQIQDLRQLFLWGFGLVFAGLFALFGFVVWDRRTALMPALRRLDEMLDRQQRMEETLKRYAEKVPELAEELRATGLLQ